MKLALGMHALRFARASGEALPRVWLVWGSTKARPRRPVFQPHVVLVASEFKPDTWDWSDLEDVPVTVLAATRAEDERLWRLVAELASVAGPVDVMLGPAGEDDWPYTPGEPVLVDAGDLLWCARTWRDGAWHWPAGWDDERAAAYRARGTGTMARAA